MEHSILRKTISLKVTSVPFVLKGAHIKENLFTSVKIHRVIPSAVNSGTFIDICFFLFYSTNSKKENKFTYINKSPKIR